MIMPCEKCGRAQLQLLPNCCAYWRTAAPWPSCCCCVSSAAAGVAFAFALPFFLGAFRCCFGAGSLPGMCQFARLFGSIGSVDPAGKRGHSSMVERRSMEPQVNGASTADCSQVST